jgi:hypothetical protein
MTDDPEASSDHPRSDDSAKSSRKKLIIGGLAVALVGALAGAGLATLAREPTPDQSVGAYSTPNPRPPDAAAASPADDTKDADGSSTQSAPFAGCPTATIEVDDAEGLHDALDQARPGDSINLQPGIYVGEFVAAKPGTKSEPISLCGPRSAVLDGDGIDGGYVLHLDGANHWLVAGFTLRNGQKGVMADDVTGVRIVALNVTKIGDEAIHLRRNSSDNAVVGNFISDTGNRREKFGEGIYIGTAESNWCDITDCQPDRSDRNLVEGNTITDTTAEAVDIKEGTTGGIVRANRFDGSALSGADSWVDVKGNDWLIEGNSGVNSPMDGFQTHKILDGWGTRNIFRTNTADVNGPGFGYSLTPVRGNVVECSNTASRAEEGVSNVECESR